MERLLADAEKLSGKKFDLSSYADIVEAIHVVQTEMGITGTTALEASETISGSINSMKAAWANFVTGLGNSNADMALLTQNLVAGFEDVVANVTPVIENIVNALPQAMDALLGAVGDLLPSLLVVVMTLFEQVLGALIAMLPALIPVAVDAVMMIAKALVDNLPLLVSAALTLIVSLAEGLITALPELIPAAVDAVMTIVETLIDNIELLVDAAIAITIALAEGLINSLPILIEKAPILLEKLVYAIIENAPKLLRAAAELIAMLITGLVTGFGQILSKVGGWVQSSIIQPIKDKVADFKKIGGELITGLWRGIADKAEWLWGKVKGLFTQLTDKIKNFFGIASPSKLFRDEIGKPLAMGVAKGIEDSTDEVVKAAKKMAEETYTTSKAWIDTRKKYNELSLAEELLAWERVKDRYIEGSKQKEDADYEYYRVKQSLTDKALALEKSYSDAVESRTSAIVKSYKLFDELTEKAAVSGQDLLKNIGDQAERLQAWSDSLSELAERGIKGGLLDEIQSMGPEYLNEINALLSLSDDDLKKYEDLFAEKQRIANERATKELKGLRSETDNQIAELVAGVEDQLDGLPDVGLSAMEGLAQGITDGMSSVVTAAVRVATAAVEATKGALGIQSPSKVYADIGGNMADGMSSGFSAQMSAATRQMNASIPTSFDAPGIRQGNNAASFLQALNPMMQLAMAQPVPGNITLQVNGIEFARAFIPDLRQADGENPLAIQDF